MTIWALVAASTAVMCLSSGCIGSRLGKNIGKMRVPRLGVLGRRKKSSDEELAKASPPASAIPPAGMAGSGSRTFPSQPAPHTGPGSYADTGAHGGYAQTGAGSPYMNTSGPSGAYRDGPAAAPQKGFYSSTYPGGQPSGQAGQYADTSGGYNGGGYDDRGLGDRGGYGGYDDMNAGSGGRGDYGSEYAGSGTRSGGYQRVADTRGDSYGPERTGGGGGDYGPAPGGSRFGGYEDSRQVSPPAGGSGYDNDYRSPAAGDYNDSYNDRYQESYNDGASSDSGGGSSFSRFSGGADGGYGGGSYDDSYNAGASYQSSQPPSRGSRSWLPGSTKPYNPEPINPPTSGYGGYEGSSNRNY